MAQITLVEAINQALTYEMTQDNSVIVLGEDVGVNGGVFRATVGLLEKFGPERVLDTPLAESTISGISIGMAAQGLKPVAEFQFGGFIYSGFDHIVSHATRLRNRTRGRLHCPIVYRAPFGGGIRAPEHHSESMEALFAHIPGLRVVIPSSPDKAYRLLLAAIRNPDPVLFLEPKRIYRLVKQDVPNDGKELALDQCFLLRKGYDVTLVTWGAMTKETVEASNQLATQGIQAEIIDVTTIKPLDMDTILSSVEKTGRCIIVHEAPLTGGVGAEIAAGIAEQGLFSLLAPIKRVTGYDTIVPYSQLEREYMPSTSRIIQAVQFLMEFS
ncbi:alpha-ketoacid dehydrogenase subunit beta [Coxiella endosymbiont of Amblyomma sculptum]|uniref:alpha-ketoacid dehydrogenase subunit beta n=1 Tax=Coxiella endosymbiont of Amblyomma sculptum TaxID=2487929 RepID=UPI00132F4AFE|nr:alpha-ketoacid dehydrogenase subunit beta [Coxiella endosymbiont of Amblyomma sculptum]QHG92348.1 alpha-ketoacid dehydrogenase subunit beta [Coxiella endosymbiont of Amblyomma sculptum]